MGLFNKQACTFCNTEVGMLKRSKLATKEFICNECKYKTNYFARMSYTSRDNAQLMIDTLGQEVAELEESFEAAEGRFARAERSFNSWDLGDRRVHYRCNTTIGAFQFNMSEMSRYENIPVFWFDCMIPYEYHEGEVFSDMRRNKVMNANAEYVQVEESKGDDGKVVHCTLLLPYDDVCIREIRIESDVSNDDKVKAFHDLADRINGDRKVWISKTNYDEKRKNRMQIRNLGDTAVSALKASVTGENLEEVIKKGIDTANDIEDGKVKQSFFGKLIKK